MFCSICYYYLNICNYYHYILLCACVRACVRACFKPNYVRLSNTLSKLLRCSDSVLSDISIFIYIYILTPGKPCNTFCNAFFQIASAEIIKNVRSYIVRYPVLGTVQSALHFITWQTCSFQRDLDFSGKH